MKQNESVWVIGYNEKTNAREQVTYCKHGNAKFYLELYRSQGYRAEMLSDEEVTELLMEEGYNV